MPLFPLYCFKLFKNFLLCTDIFLFLFDYLVGRGRDIWDISLFEIYDNEDEENRAIAI